MEGTAGCALRYPKRLRAKHMTHDIPKLGYRQVPLIEALLHLHHVLHDSHWHDCHSPQT